MADNPPKPTLGPYPFVIQSWVGLHLKNMIFFSNGSLFQHRPWCVWKVFPTLKYGFRKEREKKNIMKKNVFEYIQGTQQIKNNNNDV